jgi:hypothetical protein
MAAEVVQFERPDEREPQRAEKAHARRRTEILIKRMATAQTPRERLDVALDYFRATAANHHVNQAKADIAIDHHADRLIASADQLANTIRRTR